MHHTARDLVWIMCGWYPPPHLSTCFSVWDLKSENIIKKNWLVIMFVHFPYKNHHCFISSMDPATVGKTPRLCGGHIAEQQDQGQDPPERPISGWWFQPLWKIWKSVGKDYHIYYGNKKFLKPPTRICPYISGFPTYNLILCLYNSYHKIIWGSGIFICFQTWDLMKWWDST